MIAVQTQAQQKAKGIHSTAARISAVWVEGVEPSLRFATRSLNSFLPRVWPFLTVKNVSYAM